MTTLTTEERNLICIYDPGTRVGAIYELRNMMDYLMPDEDDLEALAEGLIAKLERMTDDEYFEIIEELAPYYPIYDYLDEDYGYDLYPEQFYDDIDPDEEIE